MSTVPFTDVFGSRQHVHIDDEALTARGIGFQSRVVTPEGPGAAVGVAHGLLYIVLDTHVKRELVTPFSFNDVTVDASAAAPAPAPAPVPVPAAARREAEAVVEHRLRQLSLRGRQVRVATQQRRGPCPVLALANALVMQGRLTLPVEREGFTTAAALRATLASCLLREAKGELAIGSDTQEANNVPVDTPPLSASPMVAGGAASADRPRTLSEALHQPNGRRRLWRAFLGEATTTTAARVVALERLLERLYNGMNVNPIFADVEHFAADEPDAALFLLAGVRLLHGWVIAAEDTYAPLRDRSFDEVVALAATTPVGSPRAGTPPTPRMSPEGDSGAGDDGHDEPTGAATETHRGAAGEPSAPTELPRLAGAFIAETAADQMTAAGRAALTARLGDGEVAVLFWHDHFFTATALGGRLLVLCSDEGFSDKPSFVFSIIDDRGEESGYAKGDGTDIEPIIAGVQARTGGQFTEAAILEMASLLAARAIESGQDPVAAASTAAVIEALEKAEAKEEKRHKHHHKDSHHEYRSKRTAMNDAAGSHDSVVGRPAAAWGAPVRLPVPPELLEKFLDVFPEASHSIASEYLSKHNNRIDLAVAAYMASL